MKYNLIADTIASNLPPKVNIKLIFGFAESRYDSLSATMEFCQNLDFKVLTESQANRTDQYTGWGCESYLTLILSGW